jgi:YVTN family beta-propeller protein
MTAQLSPVPIFKAFSNDGFPLAFGTLTTYAAGTTTPQATYVDSTQTTQNTNPIQLNFRGECNLWLDPTKSYKFILQDLFGNTVPGWPVDNITTGNANPSYNIIPTVDNLYTLGSATFSWANVYVGVNHAAVLDTVSGNIGYYARTATEISASVVPVNYSYPPGHWFRYGADPTGVADATTAINNALKSVSGAYSYGPKGTFKVTSTLLFPAQTELYCEPGCQVNYTDATPGTFAFQMGVTGSIQSGGVVRNLAIVLQTKTAGGIRLINYKFGRVVNLYVQGYTAVIDTTRTNIGLQITGDTGLVSFWNTFLDAYINNCHTAVQLPSTGANQITKQFFVNFQAWGGSTQGDTSSVCFDVQSYNGAYSAVDQGYLDGFGGYYFKFQTGTGWRVRAVNIDSESITTTTPIGVLFDAATNDCRIIDSFMSNAAQIVDLSSSINGNEFIWNQTPTRIGSSYCGAPQNFMGLNDHTGQIGSQTLTMAGSLFVTRSGGTSQTLQGACYTPSTGLICAASKQGNLLWFNPTSYYEVRGSVNYTSTLSDNNRISICYCPSNGFIYIADRADNSLVIVNPKTAAVIQTLNLVPTAGANCAPFGIAYCPFNNKVYIANNGTSNLSIINLTFNGTDTVAQTLAIATTLLSVTYCPITQQMYALGAASNAYIVTPTTNGTDSVLQTLALTGGNFYGVAYCHSNRRMYAASGSTNIVNCITPAPTNTALVASTTALSYGGNTSASNRAMVYDVAADALVILGSNSRAASIYPSSNGAADICTNVQVTAGTGVDLVYHPNAGKVYECNASNLYEYA